MTKPMTKPMNEPSHERICRLRICYVARWPRIFRAGRE
jgi:hypothetical protein